MQNRPTFTVTIIMSDYPSNAQGNDLKRSLLHVLNMSSYLNVLLWMTSQDIKAFEKTHNKLKLTQSIGNFSLREDDSRKWLLVPARLPTFQGKHAKSTDEIPCKLPGIFF